MEGLHSVWTLIDFFFSALPPEIVMVATFAFMGAVILGLWGLFK